MYRIYDDYFDGWEIYEGNLFVAKLVLWFTNDGIWLGKELLISPILKLFSNRGVGIKEVWFEVKFEPGS